MKKIGIICDNYKVEMFEKLLMDSGFSEYEIKKQDGSANMTVIAVSVKESTMKESQAKIHGLCNIVENHYKNTRQN